MASVVESWATTRIVTLFVPPSTKEIDPDGLPDDAAILVGGTVLVTTVIEALAWFTVGKSDKVDTELPTLTLYEPVPEEKLGVSVPALTVNPLNFASVLGCRLMRTT